MAATRLDLSRKLRILRGSSPAYLGWFLIGGIFAFAGIFITTIRPLPACKDFALGRHTGRSRDCLLLDLERTRLSAEISASV